LEFSLVDPDNRRPVDYERRKQILELLPRGDGTVTNDLRAQVRDLLSTCNGSSAKMYMTWKTLAFRRQQSATFQRGGYTPLTAGGGMAEHVVAFSRQDDGCTIVVVVPRLCAKLMGETHDTVCKDAIWKDTFLDVPSASVSCYHNLFTGECLPRKTGESFHIRVADLFRDFPVAMLVSEAPNPVQGCAKS
jgi:(1->4)-alpha-D-glucan 1-alpha-D-glucosylmutase